MAIVYLNGQYLPQSEAKVSVMDRGFLFADGVYELIPVYQRRPLRWSEHLQRLKNSMARIDLDNPYIDSQWQEIITGLIGYQGTEDQAIYLQVTRGAADKREHAFPKEVTPTVFAMSSAMPPPPTPETVVGARVLTLEDIRWQLCDIKAIALLGNVLMKQEALTRGYDEAILIRDGRVTECSASNLFIVKQGVLSTPPESNLRLPGITRDLIISLAKEHAVPFTEREISETELASAEELWFTSSSRAIVPIVELNDRPVGHAQPGPVWHQLIKYYIDYIDSLRTKEAG